MGGAGAVNGLGGDTGDITAAVSAGAGTGAGGAAMLGPITLPAPPPLCLYKSP
jgi:hypothetical protein